MNVQNLVWLDLEMTGLDSQNDHILEIATIVTDPQLNIIAEGPVIAIYQPNEILNTMDKWCQHYHGKSGLIERCQKSRYNADQAAQETLKFLEQFVPAKKSPLCGNSICQDRRFMAREMPELEAFFHYRNLDVSTLKELAARWYPEKVFHKDSSHQALDDIRASIDELRHYREAIFISPIYSFSEENL